MESTGRKRKLKTSLWLHRPKKKAKQKTITCTPIQPITRNGIENAPKKIKKLKTKTKRKLYEQNVTEKIIDEMTSILPGVLSKMKDVGKLGDFITFLQLVHKDKFPLQNIAFLLFLDVVRWYSLDNTSNMVYSSQAIKFWRVMYRLFHGKALRFMGGLRCPDEDSRGLDSSINFAVPSQRRILTTDSMYIRNHKFDDPVRLNKAQRKSKQSDIKTTRSKQRVSSYKTTP